MRSVDAVLNVRLNPFEIDTRLIPKKLANRIKPLKDHSGKDTRGEKIGI